MKYCIVVEPNTVDPKLATATLFDLLGDPSIWMDNHEVKFFAHETKGVAEWAEEINDIAKPVSVIEDFAALDDSWIVLGPTVEEYVKDATAAGAKYLALDDGLVELAIEEEATEVPIVPDVEDAKVEEKVEEPEKAEEVLPEVPAIPKRRQSRAKKPVVEEVNPDFESAVDEAMKLSKPEKKPLTVDSVREKGKTSTEGKLPVSTEVYMEAHLEGYVDGMVDAERIAAKDVIVESTVQDSLTSAVPEGYTTYTFGSLVMPRTTTAILRDLIGVMLELADEDQLWDIAQSIRKVVK